jgi:hypothetical protein
MKTDVLPYRLVFLLTILALVLCSSITGHDRTLRYPSHLSFRGAAGDEES